MIEPLKKGEFRESVIADKINEMVEKINEIHKAPHVHKWVEKALLGEPSLKVCACGAHEFDNEMQATGGDAIAARNRIRERRGFPEDAADNK